jgi:acyl-CoA thioesterase I
LHSPLARLGLVFICLLQLGCASALVSPTADSFPLATPTDRPNVPLRYVALGDSTVEGIGATRPEYSYVGRLHIRLQERYPQVELTNLGVGGATSADVVRDQLPRAVALRPQLITLSIGPNDLTQGVLLESYSRNLDTIFSTLREAGISLVVVNLLPDLSLAPTFSAEDRALVGQLTVAFNQVLRTQGERYGVILVDLYAGSQEEVPDAPSLIASDLYHPSDAGYARWADYFWAEIEPRLPG